MSATDYVREIEDEYLCVSREISVEVKGVDDGTICVVSESDFVSVIDVVSVVGPSRELYRVRRGGSCTSCRIHSCRKGG